MVNFKRLSDRAKDLVEKRGGTDSLKQDAEQLKNIAKGPGSLSDKAKAAAGALKEPGGAGKDTEVAADKAPSADKPNKPQAAPAPADEPSGPAQAEHGHRTEEERAERKAARKAERQAEREGGGNDAA